MGRKDPFGLENLDFVFGQAKREKRKTLTPAQRIYIWERPKIYGRTCSICHEKITRLSDLELDHTRPFSKGGKKLALAHRECNRLKSSGSLGQIQKKLGIKSKTRKKRLRRARKGSLAHGPQDILNEIIGR